MTDDDKALAKRLQGWAALGDAFHGRRMFGSEHDIREAANRIDAQAAEIERLRAALKMILDIDEQDGVNGYFLAQHYANAALGDGK